MVMSRQWDRGFVVADDVVPTRWTTASSLVERLFGDREIEDATSKLRTEARAMIAQADGAAAAFADTLAADLSKLASSGAANAGATVSALQAHSAALSAFAASEAEANKR